MSKRLIGWEVLGAALALTVGLSSTVCADGLKGTKEVSGVIVSVDQKDGTVTIRKKDDTMTFKAAADVKFGHDGNKLKGMTIADLKVGDKVTVHYKLEGDKAVAYKFGHVENTKKEIKQKQE